MHEPELRIHGRITEIPATKWDALLGDEAAPFERWAFFEALEHAGCVSPGRGWQPMHFTVWRGQDLLSAAPAYVKGDSSGDFSRDWQWADFAQSHGLAYYPKLVFCTPFTPVMSRRIQVSPSENRLEHVRLIAAAARTIAQKHGLGAIQFLYTRDDEAAELAECSLARRVLMQFHWHNRDYAAPSDWHSSLSSKRRNQLKRERRHVAEAGINIRTVRGDELAERGAQLAADVFRLYHSTQTKLTWGNLYLNVELFNRLFERMPGSLEVVEARRGGKLVAGALNLASATHLYGRYWGCVEEHRYLHFDVCQYHPIDDCIERGLRVFEAGADGAHKLMRGFDPVLTHGAVEFTDPRLAQAVGRHLEMETATRTREIERWLSQHSNR